MEIQKDSGTGLWSFLALDTRPSPKHPPRTTSPPQPQIKEFTGNGKETTSAGEGIGNEEAHDSIGHFRMNLIAAIRLLA